MTDSDAIHFCVLKFCVSAFTMRQEKNQGRKYINKQRKTLLGFGQCNIRRFCFVFPKAQPFQILPYTIIGFLIE